MKSRSNPLDVRRAVYNFSALSSAYQPTIKAKTRKKEKKQKILKNLTVVLILTQQPPAPRRLLPTTERSERADFSNRADFLFDARVPRRSPTFAFFSL